MLQAIGYVLLTIVALIAGFTVGALLVIALAVMFIVALAVWGCGVPIAVMQKGRMLGYVRWFTFYTEQEWLTRHLKPR